MDVWILCSLVFFMIYDVCINAVFGGIYIKENCSAFKLLLNSFRF